MAKRKHIRISTLIMVDLFAVDSGDKAGRGAIVNMSLGGIAIETEAPIELNKELNMRIIMPGRKEPLEIEGEVVRRQLVGSVYRYGMKYSHLNFFKRVGLKAYLTKWLDQSAINRKESL